MTLLCTLLLHICDRWAPGLNKEKLMNITPINPSRRAPAISNRFCCASWKVTQWHNKAWLNDNLWWRQSWYYDNSRFAVIYVQSRQHTIILLHDIWFHSIKDMCICCSLFGLQPQSKARLWSHFAPLFLSSQCQHECSHPFEYFVYKSCVLCCL